MKGSGNKQGVTALRLLAIAAFGGTAVLAVVVTRIPAPQDLALGVCTPSVLTASIGAASAGNEKHEHRHLHGHYYSLKFTNISRRSCSLYGYPGVSAYTGQIPVGSPAALDTSVRPQRFALAPGASAQSLLVYSGTDGYEPAQCHTVIATALRVYLPQQERAELVPFSLPVCSRSGPAVLTVQAIQPPIPGFRGMRLPLGHAG